MSTKLAIPAEICCSHGMLRCPECKAQRDALLEVAKHALEQINPRLRAATLLRQAIAACEKA